MNPAMNSNGHAVAGDGGTDAAREGRGPRAGDLRVAAIVPGVIPSTLLCVIYPLLRLEQRGWLRSRILLEGGGSPLRRCAGVDVGVFCRNFKPPNRGYVDHFIAAGVPYIYDIDDNLFAIGRDTPGGAYYHEGGRPEMLRFYIRNAALVRVYSASMLAEVSGLTDRARLVRPPIEWSMIEPRRRPRGGAVRLVYATSRNEDALSALFMEALERILAEFGDAVRMHFIGYRPRSLRGRSNVVLSPFVRDYERFMRSFSSAGYDIGLAPMLDDPFHRSKTNNKYREYGACRIAGIYSDVPLYAESVTQGETGLLVRNTAAAWYDAMKALVEDAALRERLQERAWAALRQQYSIEEFDDLWLRQIGVAAASRPASARAPSPEPLAAPQGAPPGPAPGIALRPGKIIPLLIYYRDRVRGSSLFARLSYYRDRVRWFFIFARIRRRRRL